MSSKSFAKQIIPKLSITNLPWPTDWNQVFGTPGANRPLILEIGFGYGQNLRYLSQQQPDAHIVGLEISNVCLVKAEGAIARGETPNVRVVFARAEHALHHLFTPASLDAVHINFPDPWFKSRHEHRRLMKRETVDILVNRMKPGALLHLATDILEYAEMSAEVLADTPGLTNQLDTPWVNALPGRVQTKYEKKAQRVGRSCYYFALQRNEQPGPDFPVMKELDMPHMIINTPLDFDEIIEQYEPIEQQAGVTHINFLYAYRGKRSILFEAYVSEPTIDQRLALLFVRDEDKADYVLRVSTIGSPRPTQGVHTAVRLLGDWIVGLHPDARVVSSKVR